ncbi:expressed unknown protein [Seminavis robusta]|uniref:Uncharacterized protein n=1 Tax=Seminavis robusta TaxID=568900 RepID=A0A9N8DXM5_9STRA|nr:expressed unknown protein [Seminavis robusta]|eukprot:Sro372_g128690.1 n/a (386) ;mRNA; f:10977-12134
MPEEQHPEYKLTDGDMKFDSYSCMGPEFGGDERNVPWKELERVETERREILKRVELPFWRILCYWSGTCLKALAMDWLIWVPITIFVALRIHARVSDTAPALAERLGDTDVDVLGGFLSFLLVLFVNQTNSRFFTMYQLAKRVAGQIQDAAGLVVTQLPSGAANRLVRYMNAAHVAGYVGLGGPYSKKHFFDHYNKEHKLLNSYEMKRVDILDMDSGSGVFKELCTWCQQDVGRAKKAGHVDSIEAAELHNRILNIRAAMDGLYDYTDQPTHFFYIHFLCLLSALYLPLFAVDNAFACGWGDDSDWSIELVNGLMVLVQAIFVVGLRLLGQKMVDPFGLDLEDLSVITYVSTTIENCRIILNSQQEQEVDEAAETPGLNKIEQTV